MYDTVTFWGSSMPHFEVQERWLASHEEGVSEHHETEEVMWYYLDDELSENPFPNSEMKEWYDEGYIGESCSIRLEGETSFSNLTDRFKAAAFGSDDLVAVKHAAEMALRDAALTGNKKTKSKRRRETSKIETSSPTRRGKIMQYVKH